MGNQKYGKSGNTGLALIGATQVFPLSSFCLGSSRKIVFRPGIILMDPGDAAERRPSPVIPPWLTRPPPQPPRWVAEALGTGAIPGKLSAILSGRFRTVCEDGTALPLDKRSVRGLHSFLAQLALGVDHIPGLDRVNLLGVDPDGMVHLFHSLLSVLIDIYSTSRCLFD